ncbi:hypothetical protein PsAD14_01309 [Pseudovibrio sp. Ad14]|nr:hypothetical protein PsW74_05481 [Pseudovibrio sp. W74]KZL10402.1 hypothetical protein PsAD14_01309 [Pseudovibrio sp. Ad14]
MLCLKILFTMFWLSPESDSACMKVDSADWFLKLGSERNHFAWIVFHPLFLKLSELNVYIRDRGKAC